MGFVVLNDGLLQQSRLGVHVYDRPVLMYHDGIVAMGQKRMSDSENRKTITCQLTRDVRDLSCDF